MSPAAPPTLLLLHGQPGSGRDWDRVVAEIGPAARALAIDRPGWDGRRAPTDLAGNVRAALAALDAAQAERATVVAHSFGGAVACCLAIEHPARVAALVLGAPAANRGALLRADAWLAAPLVGEVMGAAALTGLGLSLTASPLRGRIARELGLEDGYLQTVGRRLLSPAAWRAFVSEQRTLVRELPGLEDRLGAIRAPTTILAGDADRVVPVSASRRLAEQIPGARLVVLPGADHMLPLRRAGRFARVIMEVAGNASSRERAPSEDPA